MLRGQGERRDARASRQNVSLNGSSASPIRPPSALGWQGTIQPTFHKQGDFLGLAVTGGPETVRARLEVLLEQTGADELIFTGDIYQPEQRLRSFEIVAGLR